MTAIEGIQTVVVDDDVLSRDKTTPKNALNYNMFPRMVKEGKFVCYQTKLKPAGPKNISASSEKKRKLEHSNNDNVSSKQN